MATSAAASASLNLVQRKAFLEYAASFADACTEISTWRSMMELRDRAYQLQMDQTAERIAEVKKQMQSPSSARRSLSNIEVPVVMPQIESAVAYQTGVYLSNHPIFRVVSTPQNQSAATQFETVLANHSLRWGWARELIKVFRNGFKHNFGPTFVRWVRQPNSTITTSTDSNTAGLGTLQRSFISGNRITAIDPYNCFLDMTVNPAKYHEEGEAFGWNEVMSRIQLKQFVTTLDATRTSNLREAYECGLADSFGESDSVRSYYVPQINRALGISNLLDGVNWLNYAGLQEHKNGSRRINYRNRYLVTHFVCRALPSDFGRDGNTPAIFYGIIVNWKHVIYVEQMASVNDNLPVFIMTPNDDGLGYQTQSMLDTALPFQDMSSSLWNITLESKRRQVFDRLLYNPSYIKKEHIDPASSVARIPLQNASQFRGDDIGKAIFQIPYRDDNSGVNLQMSEMISQMADVASGQNKVDRGQFQKGNKTAVEFNTTMTNSNARQQLTSIGIEHQYMTPVKETVKSNLLLNQEAGTQLNRSDRTEVQIDPAQMRKAILEFTLTDGVLPVEKLLNPDMLMVFMQTAQAMPVAMTEYDVLGMFIYWAKLKGASWLDDFKRNPQQQQQFLQMYQQTAAAGQPPAPALQTPGA